MTETTFEQIPIGSLLLYKGGSSFLGKLISSFRNTPYSHAILKISEDEFTEANWATGKANGVVIYNGKELAKRSGFHDVFMPKKTIGVSSQKILFFFVNQNEHLKYDTPGIIGEAFKILGFRWFKFWNTKNKVYCSEWAHICMTAISDKPKTRRQLFTKLHQKAPDELPGTFWSKTPKFILTK